MTFPLIRVGHTLHKDGFSPVCVLVSDGQSEKNTEDICDTGMVFGPCGYGDVS